MPWNFIFAWAPAGTHSEKPFGTTYVVVSLTRLKYTENESTHFPNTGRVVSNEPHQHRLLGAGHEAEAQLGVPLQHHVARRRRGLAREPLRRHVRRGLVDMAEKQGKGFN